MQQSDMLPLSSEEKIRLSHKSLFAIFDRDGTLVPIVPHPADAIVPEAVRRLLAKLASLKNVIVGILSARGCRQLITDFGNDKMILAGNYGLEIIVPNHKTFVHPEALLARPRLDAVRASLQRKIPQDWGVVVEDHGLSICLHWQLTAKKHQGLVHETIGKISAHFPDLRIKTLPTSYEILPSIDWDKSSALSKIEEMFPIAKSEWLHFYAGDSEGDEPAFNWVNARGGLSLRVGIPSTSYAQLRIDDPPQLLELIAEIIRLRQ